MRASGVMSPMCSAKAPTNAAPDAASPAEKSAPACCEPTWLWRWSSSGSTHHAAAFADLDTVEAEVAVVGNRRLHTCANGFVVQRDHLHRMCGADGER